jgi:hypothetical protein
MKLLRKVLVFSLFLSAAVTQSHAGSLPVPGKEPYPEHRKKHITFNVYSTSTVEIMGVTCTAILSGTVTVDLQMGGATVVSQQLSLSAKCKGKLSLLNLRELHYDGRYFTHASFEEVDDKDIQAILDDPAFTAAFLASLNFEK